jgi:hypothetical protein
LESGYLHLTSETLENIIPMVEMLWEYRKGLCFPKCKNETECLEDDINQYAERCLKCDWVSKENR